MAITRIQQAQISGSLSLSDNVASEDLAKSSRSLADDLNSLRTQVKKIMGTSAWTDGLQGSQDLADIYASVRMSGANADFQGTLDVTGAATLDSTLAVVGASSLSSLGVSGATALNGGLTMDDDKFVVTNGSGNTTIAGTLNVAQAAAFASTLSAGASSLASATIAGAATVGSTLGVTGAASFSSTLSAGASSLASATIAGAATVGSTLGVTGAASFSSSASIAGGLSVTGDAALAADLGVMGDAAIMSNLDVAGDSFLNQRLLVSGSVIIDDTLSVTGASSLASATIAGAATVGSTLGVTGAASFSSTLSAGASSLASLGVAGSSVLAGPLSVAGASSMNSLSVSGSVGLAVAGPADFNGGVTANSIKIDGDTAQRLYIVDSDGSMKDEANLMYDGSKLDIIGNLRVSGNAQIDGDFLVKGAFTYIETENMKVKDAFIYLATGSNGSVDSGIVLSKGAGAGFDLIVGQDGGAGEIVFAKVAHNVLGDSPADLNGAALVKSWMSGSYYGSVEGTEIGHAGISAGKMELKSAAGVDLMLVARGDESFKLADDGDMAQFEAQFGSDVSLVDAIVAAASGGNFKQDSFNPGAVNAVSDISFSAVGALRSASIASNAAKKVAMDVYLNGVRLSFGGDYSIQDVNNIRLNMATLVDDVISVVIHNAAI